jgi:hypothetical protein
VLNGQNFTFMKSRPISHIISPTPLNPKYLAPLSPPVFPEPTRLRSRTSVSSTLTSPTSKQFQLLSLFKDPTHQSLQPPSFAASHPPVRSRSPSPQPPDIPNKDALEEFKKDTTTPTTGRIQVHMPRMDLLQSHHRMARSRRLLSRLLYRANPQSQLFIHGLL